MAGVQRRQAFQAMALSEAAEIDADEARNLMAARACMHSRRPGSATARRTAVIEAISRR
nr:hypothetical protein [uncultured Rhodopila sp.]